MPATDPAVVPSVATVTDLEPRLDADTDAEAIDEAKLAPWRAARRGAANGSEAPAAHVDGDRRGAADTVAASLGQTDERDPTAAVADWNSGSSDYATIDDQDGAESIAAALAKPAAEDDASVTAELDEIAPEEAAGDSAPAAGGEGGKTAKVRVSKEERAAERSRRKAQAAAEGIEEIDPSVAQVVPIVRHLNVVTKELALAYRTIGQVTAERDAFRRQTYQLQGLPDPDEVAAKASKEGRGETKDARAEARAAKQAERSGIDPTMTEEEIAEHLRKTVRRRRMIALGALAVLTITYVGFRIGGFNWSEFSRDSLANIAIVGPFFNVLLIGFVFYRLFAVGGKASRWLFPGDSLQRKRRR